MNEIETIQKIYTMKTH